MDTRFCRLRWNNYWCRNSYLIYDETKEGDQITLARVQSLTKYLRIIYVLVFVVFLIFCCFKLPFTTSKTELDYYHEKFSVRAVPQFAERLKTENVKGTVMPTEEALKYDRLRVSKLSWNFHIPIIFSFAVIHPWNLLIP